MFFLKPSRVLLEKYKPTSATFNQLISTLVHARIQFFFAKCQTLKTCLAKSNLINQIPFWALCLKLVEYTLI